MKKFKGMKVEEVVKALEEMEVKFAVEQDDEYDDCLIIVGDYYYDHVEMEVEDGVVEFVEYVEWL